MPPPSRERILLGPGDFIRAISFSFMIAPRLRRCLLWRG
jgi:hypothetical protein